MDDLLQEFIAETRDTLQALSSEIVGWEADPGDCARLDAIFRFVHTIKGSCGFLDLPRLARLSHGAEDALAAIRSGDRSPTPALVTAILAIIDRIAVLVEALDTGVAVDHRGEDALLEALSEAEAAGAATGQDPVVPVVVPATTARAATRSVRLSVDLLDRMMSGVSEMVLARNQLTRRLREMDDPRLESTLERLSHTVAELRDTVTRTRMQRIEALFQPLPRIVRDTAGSLGKTVTLSIDGGDVELDREMIELLRDPLVHMVRNALDHGLETPDERARRGKPAAGALRVSARQAGSVITVDIADDGRGIDVDRLVAKIVARQPGRAAAIARLSERQRLDLIFEPGLSSKDEVTSLSGRGVGMDVVRANVEQIGGRIVLENRPGWGLRVSIEVPLTLAILNAVIVETAGSRFAIPRQAVQEIVKIDPAHVRIDRFGANAMAMIRGRNLALVDLGGLIAVPVREADHAMLAIVSSREGDFAIPLSQVLDTQELVVKPAAPAVMAVGIYAGHMLPDDGVPILLLDCAAIASRAGLTFEAAPAVEIETPVEPGFDALLFEDVDGVRRVIAAGAVDRIEAVGDADIREAGGDLWLTAEARAVRVWSGRSNRSAHVRAVIRLRSEAADVVYPIAEVIDMVHLPDELLPSADPLAAGVVVHDGEPLELVDPLALIDPATLRADRPICLVQGEEGGWIEAFLRTTIEAAGYRFARTLPGDETAAVTLVMEGDACDAGDAIRLSRSPGRGLYRYDRAALADTLAERRA